MAYNILYLDPAKWRVWFAGQKYRTFETHKAMEWCRIEGADLCFNLTTFNMANGMADTYVKAKGQDIAYGQENAGVKLLTIDQNNQCLGYSNGIINGSIAINHPMGGKRTRNGIGISNKGYVIIAQSSTNTTENGFCVAVNNFVRARLDTVKLFLLEDGGGSTQEYSNMSKLNFAPEGGRKCPTVVCVKQKAPQIVDDVVYKGGKNKADIELVQIALGGIECDGIAGTGTATRIRLAQKALGFPVALQCGIAGGKTIRAFGFSY